MNWAFGKARSYAHINPGEWAYVTMGDTAILIVACPECAQEWTVNKATVAFDGKIVRPLKCPYLNCGTTYEGELEEWTP